MERQLQKLHWLKVKELVPDKINTVILPVGTIEGHGSICIGTDNYIPENISLGIAKRVDALVAQFPVFNETWQQWQGEWSVLIFKSGPHRGFTLVESPISCWGVSDR